MPTMLSCTETTLVAEIAAAEGQTTALCALLHTAQAAWAEREALRDRQEMVLRREAERDEEELERLRGHELLDRTERRSDHAMQTLQEVRLSLESRAQESALPGGGGGGRTSSTEWAAAMEALEHEKDLERSAALHAQAAAHEAERAEVAHSAAAERSARHAQNTHEREAAVARAREEERAAARLQSVQRAEVARGHARRGVLVQLAAAEAAGAAAEAARRSAAEGEAVAQQAAEDGMRRMAYEAAAREAAVAHALRESEAETRSVAAAAEATRRESSMRVHDGRKAERAAEAEERRARASGVEVANALRKKLGEVRRRWRPYASPLLATHTHRRDFRPRTPTATPTYAPLSRRAPVHMRHATICVWPCRRERRRRRRRRRRWMRSGSSGREARSRPRPRRAPRRSVGPPRCVRRRRRERCEPRSRACAGWRRRWRSCGLS